jgi:hypothetical protein
MSKNFFASTDHDESVLNPTFTQFLTRFHVLFITADLNYLSQSILILITWFLYKTQFFCIVTPCYLVNICQSARHHIPEDLNFYQYRSQTIVSCNNLFPCTLWTIILYKFLIFLLSCPQKCSPRSSTTLCTASSLGRLILPISTFNADHPQAGNVITLTK